MRIIFSLLMLFSVYLPAVEERFILVTGCARSGTRYMAFILRDCGLDVGHEWVFPDGLTSWLMAADSKVCPWEASAAANYQFKHTFHQVRHPLKVIASVYTCEPPQSWDYICEHLPQIKSTDTHLVKCAKYWYYWNLMAEKKAELTYRIEDLDNALLIMSERTGYDFIPKDIEAFSKDINTRGKTMELTWDILQEELPCELFFDIQMMALRYGYEIE